MASQSCDEPTQRCLSPCDRNADVDGDGHRAQNCGGDDCDDNDANRYPGNTEVCDGSHDEDCNAGTVGDTDMDTDGYVSSACCNARTGMPSVCGDDCNDMARSVHPSATEACNGIDDNCNGTADDSLPIFTYYPDCDGDNFGDMSVTMGLDACGPPVTPPTCGGVAPMAQWVRNNGDCDDLRAQVNPGTVEICDGLDNNCNGMADEGLPSMTFYRDCDGDNFGDSTSSAVMNCGTPTTLPTGCPAPSPFAQWSANDTDCNDADGSVNPGAAEVCNGIDDNCNGLLDGPAEDGDGDGHANNNCAGARGTDCDDSNASIYVGAAETCDRIDSNCSVTGHAHPAGMAPVNFTETAEDQDNDGHALASAACTGGFAKDDCDDSPAPGAGAVRFPGNTETCDGVDNDCDSVVDDASGGPAGSVCYPSVLGFGSTHGCALREGVAFCWGSNTNGELGNGGGSPQRGAVRVGSLSNLKDIDGGAAYSCAVTAAGGVYCWGSGFQGQLGDGASRSSSTPVIAMGLTNAQSIDLGYNHACVIRGTGTVNCWGQGGMGQLGRGTTTNFATPPTTDIAGITDAVQVAAGQFHTCVLHRSGRVSCWGWNVTGMLGNGTTTGSNSPVQVSGITDAVEIASTNFTSCARRMGGQVVCWGGNMVGQIGDGTMTDRTTPVNVSGLSDAVEIAGEAMGYHFCARRASGAVVCWGQNTNGQLGDGTTTNRSTPVATGLTSNIAHLAVGANFSCAQRVDGRLTCWGADANMQLGDGATTDRNRPSNTGVFTRVLGLTTGGGDLFVTTGGHTCARTTDSRVVCWGNNSNGQLGDGTTTLRAQPVTVSGLANVAQVSAGGGHTCAIDASGQAYCWGRNSVGQLGDGTMTERHAATAVTGVTDAIQIAAGWVHTCALRRGGTVACWGQNRSGELGNGSVSTVPSPVPADVPGLSGIVQIAVGGEFTCARPSSGAIACWGANSAGQLGNNSTTNATTPVGVTGLSGATDIGAGWNHACAISGSGAPVCWGWNSLGQLGDGTTTDRSAPTTVSGITDAIGIDLGAQFSCAVRANGLVSCWGAGTAGQLGNAGSANSPTPVAATQFSDLIEVSAAQSFTCARSRARGVACWGQADQQQLGNGATANQNTPLLDLDLP
jgi:alpha-tubulin suppressor-like RCC1 family protein